MENNAFKHIGVKGMHWGVRKNRGSSSSPKKPNPLASSPEHLQKQVIRKKRPRQLTNKEMQDYINRVNLESQYKSLTMSKKEKGKKYVRDLLAETGKTAIKENSQVLMNMAVRGAFNVALKKLNTGIVIVPKKK